MKLFTDEMDKCEHPTTWPDGTCPDCKWNMWEAYGANQEEVDRANEIKVLKGLSKDALIAQLKASQTIIKEAHDKLLNVNAVSWEETAWEVKELLKIREVKR